MFCYQCEETAKGTGCVKAGVCGKDPEVAALQDLLTGSVTALARIAWPARKLGVQDEEVDRFVVEALFSTVTNVDFDPARLAGLVRRGSVLAERALAGYLAACAGAGEVPEIREIPSACVAAPDVQAMVRQGEALVLLGRFSLAGEVATGLQELILYGLKGMAAYADHALALGYRDAKVAAFLLEALSFLASSPTEMGDLLGMALRVGEVNLKVMELLDRANTGTYGHPVPTRVRVTPVKGKAILVSGHDLLDLYELLRQTRGTGINVYTHGEMLPAHGYPGLRSWAHLAGNYGGAWQDQRDEFDAFPGAILMTTNCIQKPKAGYLGRIFTSGVVAWPGVTHIGDRDFSPVIEAALAAPGFEEDGPEATILVGFGHEAVLGVADRVVQAVRSGALRHFFLIGGCDGHHAGRSYYTDLAKAVPDDCAVLTLACGKFRFNRHEFGDIGGIPRLLDMGQCNDAWSAIVVAQALAAAFDTDVNSLPLSLVLSWYEQKAVCILLSLLHLGIRNIRLGPELPAFVTPPVLKILVDTFGLKPIGTAEGDLADMLGEPARGSSAKAATASEVEARA